MKRFLIFIATIFTILTGCQNQSNEKPEVKKITVKEIKIELTDEEALKKEVKKLRGGNGIKSSVIKDKKVIVEYAKDYKEHKELNPKSRVTEEDWNAYWETKESIQKALNDASVRLMKNLDFIEETEIIIPHKEKTYAVNVSKEQLEKFLGKSFEEVKEDWLNNFSNEYVFSESGREKFFKAFGSVK